VEDSCAGCGGGMKAQILAIVAHYDCGDRIDDYFLFLIEQLKEVASEIIVVSASDLAPSELGVLGPSIRLIKRSNVGYDFGSWKDGLTEVENLSHYDRLILVNDSFYAGRHCFFNLFEKMSDVRCDFWGVTESREIERHLQSYFLVFKPACFRSASFELFWSHMDYLQDKDDVIFKGEIGLSRALREAGFRSARVFIPTVRETVRGVWRASKLAAIRRVDRGKEASYIWRWHALKEFVVRTANTRTPALNPTHMLWDRLIARGIRLVKIELLRRNPEGVDLSNLRSILNESGFPVSAIDAHLARVYDRGF
jgi:rhamnosyltransferase